MSRSFERWASLGVFESTRPLARLEGGILMANWQMLARGHCALSSEILEYLSPHLLVPVREFLWVDELESLDIYTCVWAWRRLRPFCYVISHAVLRVSLEKKNPRSESFLCSGSSSHFQRTISRISWKMRSESPWPHNPLPVKITSKSREPLVQISVL